MNTKQKILVFLSRRSSATGGELREYLSLSRQAMSLHLRSLLETHQIVRSGTTRGARYSVSGKAEKPITITRQLPIQDCDEDRVWRQLTAQLSLERVLRPNVVAIARYAFTEMLNNAIDPFKAIRSMRTFIDARGYKTKIMAASFKNSQQVIDSLESGAHTATIPPDVLNNMMNKDLALQALQVFEADGQALLAAYGE